MVVVVGDDALLGARWVCYRRLAALLRCGLGLIQMNPDVLACLNETHTVEQAYLLVDALQRIERKEVRLAAVLLVADVVAEELGTRLPDLLSVVDNLSRDSTRRRVPNVAAMHDYVREEILK